MIDLFDFQLEDVEKLKDCPGRLIANEMGTGKTYEAIALDEYLRKIGAKGRTLVIAPLTVLSSWENHYGSLTDLKVRTIDPKNRALSFSHFTSNNEDVFMLHWEALRLMPELRNFTWLHIVADECHRMQNRKAQQTQALKKIKALFRTGLSGTPTTGNPEKLWSVLNWLYPNEWRSFWKYYAAYVDYEIVYPQGYHKIVGPKNEDDLKARIAPYYTRRMKKDVLKDLPDKYYTDIWVDLLPIQRKAYRQMDKELIAWVGEHEDQPLVAPIVVAQLMRLQQFSVAYAEVAEARILLSEPSSKLDALMQLLEDNPEKQFVVFSQFKQLIKLLEKRLDKADITYSSLTGDTPQALRGPEVVRFQKGDAQVFVGTIAAGGVGITLHAASTVVFLDRSWSPALNQQAEDRLHRIGQKDSVQVIDIMARSTVDLGRRQRLELKWDWIRRLLGDGNDNM